MIYSKYALVVSSCQARKCHPETCCCDDQEGAIMDYKKSYNGHDYFGVIKYGFRPGLELELKRDRK